MPTADGQLFCDEFIGEVIGIARLTKLHIDLPAAQARSGDWTTAPGGSAEFATIALIEMQDPNDNASFYNFRGEGKSMGFALADARRKIAEHFGR